MSFTQDVAYPRDLTLAAYAEENERADFLTKTYMHLAGAVSLFVILEALLLSLPGIDQLVFTMVGGRLSWFIVLGAFMLVSFVAERWAQSSVSATAQYAGLGLYVLAESVIFVPILFFASRLEANVIPTAGITTLGSFAGLTAIVFITRKDFSFLRAVLFYAGLAALGLIVCSMIFGFSLGIVFTVAMIALASGYVLYHTSNVLHHYHIGQHVAASLALFASIALLFWYILQLFMRLNSRR
jgi:uncharacterized protein